MCCTTKNNVMILFELSLIKSNHLYAEIKYKSETNMIEKEFENFLTINLSEGESNSRDEDFACR